MAVNTIKLTSVVMDGECVRMTDHTGLNLDLILTPQTDQYTEHRHTTLFYRYWPTTGLKKCILGFFFPIRVEKCGQFSGLYNSRRGLQICPSNVNIRIAFNSKFIRQSDLIFLPHCVNLCIVPPLLVHLFFSSISLLSSCTEVCL